MQLLSLFLQFMAAAMMLKFASADCAQFCSGGVTNGNYTLRDGSTCDEFQVAVSISVAASDVNVTDQSCAELGNICCPSCSLCGDHRISFNESKFIDASQEISCGMANEGLMKSCASPGMSTYFDNPTPYREQCGCEPPPNACNVCSGKHVFNNETYFEDLLCNATFQERLQVSDAEKCNATRDTEFEATCCSDSARDNYLYPWDTEECRTEEYDECCEDKLFHKYNKTGSNETTGCCFCPYGDSCCVHQKNTLYLVTVGVPVLLALLFFLLFVILTFCCGHVPDNHDIEGGKTDTISELKYRYAHRPWIVIKVRLSQARSTVKLLVASARRSTTKGFKEGEVVHEHLAEPSAHFAKLPKVNDMPKGRTGFFQKLCCSAKIPLYFWSWMVWIPVIPLIFVAPIVTHLWILVRWWNFKRLHLILKDIIMMFALHVVQGPMSAIDIFEFSAERDYFLLVWFFIAVPWRYQEQKVTALARYRFLGPLSRMIHLPDDEDPKADISSAMLTAVYYARSDAVAEKIIRNYEAKGANLDYKYENGTTILIRAVKNGHINSVKYLLSQGVDTSAQSHYTQMNAVHFAIRIWHSSFARWHSSSDKKLAKFLTVLCAHNRTNLTDVDNMGRTPYMYFVEKEKLKRRKLSLEVLKPKPSFQAVEKVLVDTDLPIETKCEKLYGLIEKGETAKIELLHRLRFIDMLFCKHEGAKRELNRRRKLVFENFLKPLLLKSVKETKLSKANSALLKHVYYQSAGPPGTPAYIARSSYSDDFQQTMKEAQFGLMQLYGEAYEETLAMARAKELYDIPKKQNYILPKALAHYSFMKVPHFVESFSFREAAQELKNLGVITTAGDYSDIVQGKHRLFGTDFPPFTDSAVIDFNLWQTFVLFWQIRVQEKIELKFVQAMKSLAGDMKVEFHAAPGVKKYDRSLEKTKEYALEKGLAKTGFAGYFEKDRVALGLGSHTAVALAPMHVIDGLRCSFTVDSVEDNLRVGKEIETRFGVARSKNMHRSGNLSYADRKYNVVFEVDKVEGVDGPVRIICEVQILMRKYIEIKKIGHSLYEFQRKPSSEKSINHRDSRRRAAWLSSVLVVFLGIFLFVGLVLLDALWDAGVEDTFGFGNMMLLYLMYVLIFYFMGKVVLSQEKRAEFVRSMRESFKEDG
ncbi:MAG: hypothetical protein SGBAC_003494 [Bacillariaceae sp.]